MDRATGRHGSSARGGAVSPPVTSEDGTSFLIARDSEGGLSLYVLGSADSFTGTSTAGGKACPLTPENARELATRFDWLTPKRLPPDRVSFGFGDRLGLATPGHIRALGQRAFFPVLAQQSVRENARTGRSFADVLADVVFAVFRESYSGGFGADADHLKVADDALEAAKLGYTFFTCDPGDFVTPVEGMSEAEVLRHFEALGDRQQLKKRYANRSFGVGDSAVLHFSEGELCRAAVKYGSAIDHAVQMYGEIREILGADFDYEVSVDETEHPTSPLEHLFIALELHHREVDFVSLAPRFVGAMEKGVEWRGDLETFSLQLDRHASIARAVGGYRLSLHSGSDKYSLYPLIAEATDGQCHIKTAGTSYLAALAVIARCAPALFREIASSLATFEENSATYHLSADPSRIPSIESLDDDRLRALVDAHDSRQVLHVAYGTILASPLGDQLRAALVEHEDVHYAELAEHLGRHLDALEVDDSG